MSHFLKDYSYSFSPELVATVPVPGRTSSRLMILNRHTQSAVHKNFSNITEYFTSGDVLVLNDSKVFPARLITQRPGGGRQEIFLIREVEPKLWQVIVNASRKLKKGDRFVFKELEVVLADDHNPQNEMRLATLEYSGDLDPILKKIGHIPLPPYIKREDNPADHEHYQTVFAKHKGSVAAPTAGLHFTRELLDQLEKIGVQIVTITLHVGPGTFLPVKTPDITVHKMHTEYFSISRQTCDVINAAKHEGRRVTAVGTTSTRVLESLARKNTLLEETSSQTDIFIHPPYPFKIVDRLITNFHQPESTLLMLVSAFAGREFVLSAYRDAIRRGYRLFSYGDAMMIE